MSFKDTMTICLCACLAQCSAFSQVYNASQHAYWPMTVGSRWVYQTESSDSARNGLVTVVEVLPSLPTFGCLYSGSSAQQPYHIGFFKTDPRAYWNIDVNHNLRFMLGVQPQYYSPTYLAGSLFALGWYRTGLSHAPLSSSSVNLRSSTPLTSLPYLMLRGDGSTSAENSYHNVFESFLPAPDTSCLSAQVLSNVHWTVNFTANQWYSTPGYTGYTLKAQYDEVISSSEEYLEDWYFASGVGPVVIHTHKQGSVVPSTLAWQRMKLVSYQPGSGVSGPAGVTLRDALIARASVTSGLNWDQWNYYFTLVTNLSGPYASYACVSNSSTPMSVDTYLNYLEAIGGSCGNIVYPSLSNGSSPNTVLQQMTGTPGGSLRTWTDWNLALKSATNQQVVGQLPQNVCMLQVGTEYPASNLLLTARQWLLFYEHYYISTTITCAS